MSDPQQWTARETELLNSAVEKMIRFGEGAGVTPEEMVALLDCWTRDAQYAIC